VLVNGRLVALATVRTALSNLLPVVDLVPTDQAQADLPGTAVDVLREFRLRIVTAGS
jgi:hypothetical protein